MYFWDRDHLYSIYITLFIVSISDSDQIPDWYIMFTWNLEMSMQTSHKHVFSLTNSSFFIENYQFKTKENFEMGIKEIKLFYGRKERIWKGTLRRIITFYFYFFFYFCETLVSSETWREEL